MKEIIAAWRIVRKKLMPNESLCDSIRFCATARLIGHDEGACLMGEMMKRMPNDKSPNQLWWPLGESGYKERIKFIDQIIRELNTTI